MSHSSIYESAENNLTLEMKRFHILKQNETIHHISRRKHRNEVRADMKIVGS